MRDEYAVGNPEVLEPFEIADTGRYLVNGAYPVNSRGESYGPKGYAAYVGFGPDLVSAVGTNGEDGYTCDEDMQAVPRSLPEGECPHEFEIPLYDAEHKEIGKYAVSCGGHLNPAEKGMSIGEVKAILAAGGAV